MTLACKHVDDVVIGAPYIMTEDLMKSLNISKVITITDTEEDPVLKKHKDLDPYKVPREQGKLVELQINDEFYNLTTEKIAVRVLDNRAAYELKFKKKSASQNAYYASKQTHQEQA